MSVATILLRDGPPYRLDAFIRGLQALKYAIARSEQPKPGPGDVLVVWNRFSVYEAVARRYEAAGATVLVTENGYIGVDEFGHHLFALSQSHHNGAGKWHCGVEDRWAMLGIGLTPWRRGEDVLVLPQRGVGPKGVAMPRDWEADVVARLRKITKRNIRVRPHPGKDKKPLEPDFRNVHAAVTWGSGAAIKAIVAGIPVFHEMPAWIGAPAAKGSIQELERPFLEDRLPMLRRLAWAQWDVSEISSGKAFRCLLRL